MKKRIVIIRQKDFTNPLVEETVYAISVDQILGYSVGVPILVDGALSVRKGNKVIPVAFDYRDLQGRQRQSCLVLFLQGGVALVANHLEEVPLLQWARLWVLKTIRR